MAWPSSIIIIEIIDYWPKRSSKRVICLWTCRNPRVFPVSRRQREEQVAANLHGQLARCSGALAHDSHATEAPRKADINVGCCSSFQACVSAPPITRLANQQGLLHGWGRSYLGVVKQNVARARARAAHPNRGPGPHPRPPCNVPRTLAASAKLAAQSWRSSRNCRTSDRRKHAHPSFHLRDDRTDGSAAETTSIHPREAQAEAAHLHQQRRLAA